MFLFQQKGLNFIRALEKSFILRMQKGKLSQTSAPVIASLMPYLFQGEFTNEGMSTHCSVP
jgi:hypothetical protein